MDRVLSALKTSTVSTSSTPLVLFCVIEVSRMTVNLHRVLVIIVVICIVVIFLIIIAVQSSSSPNKFSIQAHPPHPKCIALLNQSKASHCLTEATVM